MQLVKTTRDTLLRPLQIVSGIVERRHTMPVLAEMLVRVQQRLPKGLADALDGDEISFLTVAELVTSVKTLTKLPCRLTGLGTQGESSQQQDSNLCPNFCLIPMLGPTARAPPVGNSSKRSADGNKKSVFHYSKLLLQLRRKFSRKTLYNQQVKVA
jgi:hypothetical protein